MPYYYLKYKTYSSPFFSASISSLETCIEFSCHRVLISYNLWLFLSLPIFYDLTVLKRNASLHTLANDLGLCNVFSWSMSLYVIGEDAREKMSSSLCITLGYIRWPAGDVNLDHLVNVVSVRILHCNVIILLFVIIYLGRLILWNYANIQFLFKLLLINFSIQQWMTKVILTLVFQWCFSYFPSSFPHLFTRILL